MNSLTVLAPGLLTTVQDLGREGFGPMGVSASGAADALALRIGNKLLGNPEDAAALEMTLLGGTFQFSAENCVAISGSDFGATLDGQSLATHTAFKVQPGQALKFGPTKSGARAYLCVRGGLDVPKVLGSRSTHLLSGLGGWAGRALCKGDVLPIGGDLICGTSADRSAAWKELESTRGTIRVTQGPQWENFSESVRKQFFEQSYVVTEEANRMGIRLKGTQHQLAAAEDMITEGVSLGAIQVTPSGQPIILFVEQQTTGGYPKIANVIAADFSSVGQLRPRDEIHFELVTMDAARELYREQELLFSSV
ncbi:MAG TPA: biotin-dependent carboxyltransferase family protein [Candidatus Angelobacter sp.]|nr:biotin-dependent carboxyltransferase family protein [Candidatus Angelobacter sp.]